MKGKLKYWLLFLGSNVYCYVSTSRMIQIGGIDDFTRVGVQYFKGNRLLQLLKSFLKTNGGISWPLLAFLAC